MRCETTVCVLCAPEIPNTEDEPDYKPMSEVGICNQRNNTARNQPRTSSRDETDLESALTDLKASDEAKPVQFEIENEQSSSAVSGALKITTNNSSGGSDIKVPDKRKQ